MGITIRTSKSFGRGWKLLLPVALVFFMSDAADARLETLRWLDGNPSPSPVVGFRVYVGTQSQTYVDVFDVGYPMPNLGEFAVDVQVSNTATLYFAMTSYDIMGQESDFSIEGVRLPPVGTGPSLTPNGVIDDPASSASIFVGQSVVFSGTGSDPDGDPLSYHWDFDAVASGIPVSTLEDPGQLVFDAAGIFDVTLTVTDNHGLSDATPPSVTIEVVPAGQQPGSVAPAPIAMHTIATVPSGDAVFLTAPDGDPRLYVVERSGLIGVVEGGGARATPFLDLRGDVSNSVGGGLLGLAFDPDYSNNGYVFVYRTDAGGDSLVSRFEVDADGYTADPTSEVEILTLAQTFQGNRGGTVAFGPDGYLYVGLGDGGASFDPGELAQDGLSLHGKILRLDVSVPPVQGSLPGGGAYAIPASNPFVGDANVLDEIWALGVRNPYRLSFDRDTGDLWIADQGEAQKQELDFETAADAGGHNYGWDIKEGSDCNPTDASQAFPCNSGSLTDPIFEYANSADDCAIIGGFVYRGALQDFDGEYLFADDCSGSIWSYDRVADIVTNRTAELSAFLGGTLNVQ